MAKNRRITLLGGSSKKFRKSFRGLVTGKIWKETKKPKKNTQNASESPSVVDTKSISSRTFDDETIYIDEPDRVSKVPTAVTIDSQTKESQNHTEPLADLIIIVLLLIDPVTRRFQLLRLELDATKPTVAEILQRIPNLPATEESLRTQTFDCMCDIEGLEYDHEKHMSEYVDGSAVVIAVPNTNAKGTENVTRIAKSILQRRKVEAMLKAADIFHPSVQLKENLEHEEDSSRTSEDFTSKCIDRSINIKPTALSQLTPYSQRQLEAADDTFHPSVQIKKCLEQEEIPNPTSEDMTSKCIDIFIKSPALPSLSPSSKRPKPSNRFRHLIFAGVSPASDGQIIVSHREEEKQEFDLEEIQQFNSAIHEVCYESPLLCA